jgi:histidinol dehydrogenase
MCSDAIPNGVAKKLVHGHALVDKDPHVAFGPSECHCALQQCAARAHIAAHLIVSAEHWPDPNRIIR